MDKERANFTKVVQSIRDTFTINPVVIHMPIGSEEDFQGVVDLVGNTAWMFTDQGKVKPLQFPRNWLTRLRNCARASWSGGRD